MKELVLVFEVDGHSCGLLAPQIREVVRAVAVQALPGAPPMVDGCIDVRGELVTVISMRARFGFTPRLVQPDEFFILTHAGTRPVALRVDSVTGLEQLEVQEPEIVGWVSDQTPGLACRPDGLIFIQNLASLLAPSDEAGLSSLLGRVHPDEERPAELDVAT
jgi:chemotaxis signal transduction protein